MKICWEDLRSGEKGETDDFYWFEEEGINEVDDDWIGHGHYTKYKIEITEDGMPRSK